MKCDGCGNGRFGKHEITCENHDIYKHIDILRLIDDAYTTMNHAKIFVLSREKMHHDGQDQYMETLEKLRNVVKTTESIWNKKKEATDMDFE